MSSLSTSLDTNGYGGRMSRLPFSIVGFDLDGTLLDTAADLGAAVNHALALVGRAAVPPEQVSALIGGGSRLMLARALALTGGAENIDLPPLYAALLAHYEANIAVHTRLYPGGAAMLDALAASSAKLAVVTNKPERLAVKLLGELGLLARFDCVIGGGSPGIAALKPAPDPLHAMTRRLGGGAAAFVGDSSFDIRAARAAGLPSVAVSFGFNDLPVDELGADAVIDHFDELIPALAAL